MTLSGNERAELRRLGEELGRRDPRLAWQLSAFTTLEDTVPTWRPPRVAVAVAAVMVAGVVFLVTAVAALMQAPCPAAPDDRGAASGRGTTTRAAAGDSSAAGAQAPAGPAHRARPSPSEPRPLPPSAVPC